MATALLIVIYIQFIGLGVPDSLFGAAWPAIYVEFGLPVSAAGYIAFFISSCTMLSSLFCTKAINKFGTDKVTLVSTFLAAIALFGFSVAKNVIWFILFAVPLGFGAGAIDAALNNYTALHYKASHINFLHCFYGIGVTFSPYIMSVALSQNNWRGGYRIAFYILFSIFTITLLTLPLWKKAQHDDIKTENIVPRTLSMAEMAKMPSVRAACIIFLTSCSIENIFGTWGSTYLVNSRAFTPEDAARTVSLYYGGIALARFLSGILSSKLTSWQLIHIGQYTILAALILMLLPIGNKFAWAFMLLAGLGIGPLFPNFIHLTPINFGKDVSQSVIGSQMASAYIGIMFMPPLFGFIAGKLGTVIMPYFLLVIFVFMIIYTYRLINVLKKQKL